MIPAQSQNYLIRVTIRHWNWIVLFIRASLILFLLGFSFFSLVNFIKSIETMKIHPAPKKRNITFRYDINSSLSESERLMGRQKKLRRLPHIFSKVLELPFRSDADVLIEESPNSFRFILVTDALGHDVRAHTVEICPNVTKIVIRGSNILELSLDELQLDMWRFRLPSSTRPELARSDYVDGKLIVTVPKGPNSDNPADVNDEEGNGDLRGGVGRLLLVQ